MALSPRLLCFLSVCTVSVWCATRKISVTPANVTVITEVGRRVSILWEIHGLVPKEDILIKKKNEEPLARYAFRRLKAGGGGKPGVTIIGTMDTQFGVRIRRVQLEDAGSYRVQIGEREILSEANLVVLDRPRKAEVNVTEGWACCTAESVSKPEKFRPPMMYSWNLISSEVETPIIVNATCVNITHDIQAASCYGFEEGGNLSSPISPWKTVNEGEIQKTTTLNTARTEVEFEDKTAVAGNDKSITLIVVLAITIPTIMASLIAIIVLQCRFSDLAINGKHM